MTDINSTAINLTMPIVGPIIKTIQGFMGIMQWLLGGIFGLYLVFLTLRWLELRRVSKIAMVMKTDLKELRNSVSNIEAKIDKYIEKPTRKIKKKVHKK